MKTVPYDRKQKQNREVYLLTAADEREYDVYKSLLDAYGIPVLKNIEKPADILIYPWE